MSYSINKELRYGTEGHRRVLEALLERLYASRKKMETWEEKFERAEEQQRAYIPETAVDQRRRQDWENSGIMDYRTVVVPYDYSTVMSAHTYWSSVFLGREPILEFTGRGGEDEHKIMAVNAVQDYQVNSGGWKVPLYTWLHDAASYPFGVIGSYWTEEMHTIMTMREEPVLDPMGIPIEGTSQKVKTVDTIRGYTGNKLFKVRPITFRPDPRVPVYECEKGEFCGREEVFVGFNTILKGKQSGLFYNLDEVKRYRAQLRHEQWTSTVPDKEAPDADDFSTSDIPDAGTVELAELYVELIPKDWKLGPEERPIIWRFTVADEHTIIESRPCGNFHNRFPYYVLPFDFEAHDFMGRSLYEVMEPLNNVLTWLVNSHMYNVRAMLNNKLLVDPSKVVMKDVTATDQRVIRLKPETYGTDPRTAIHQLQVGDVTQGHMRDAQGWMEFIQRATGVNDNLMGAVNQGGRKTATEVRSSSTMGINRLKTVAEWWSAVGWEPLARTSLQNTQQYLEEELELRIRGDRGPKDQPVLRVSPADILGQFDYVPVDGTMPVDKFALANLWREILANMRQMPDIAQQYDMGGIFSWVAKLAGLKNIDQFRIQLTPQEEIMQNVERGNLVPISGGQGGRASAGRDQQSYERSPDARQVPGMGRTS